MTALLAGQTFGHLSIVGVSERRASRHRHYVCRCVCGTELDVRAGNLVSGRTRSCGCMPPRPRRIVQTAPPPERPARPGMLPVYQAPPKRPSERTPQHDERAEANHVARVWGVERNHACAHYGACLRRVPPFALDALCLRGCDGEAVTQTETREGRMAAATVARLHALAGVA